MIVYRAFPGAPSRLAEMTPMKTSRYGPAVGLGLALAGVTGIAVADDASDLSSLEQVTVYAPHASSGGLVSGNVSLGGTAITMTDMQQFNRDTLDRAFVLASGTSASLFGPRNETNIWIRGFDRWRVPLYQDGIPSISLTTTASILAASAPSTWPPSRSRRDSPRLSMALEPWAARSTSSVECLQALRSRSALSGRSRFTRLASGSHRGYLHRHPPGELVHSGRGLV